MKGSLLQKIGGAGSQSAQPLHESPALKVSPFAEEAKLLPDVTTLHDQLFTREAQRVEMLNTAFNNVLRLKKEIGDLQTQIVANMEALNSELTGIESLIATARR